MPALVLFLLLSFIPRLILSGKSRTCPPHWVYRYQSDACYHYNGQNPLNWDAAQTFCKHTDGGNLVSVLDEGEYNFVKGKIIGQNSLLLTWIGLQGNSSHWTSGDEVEFKKWVSPNDANRDSHYCAGLRTQGPRDGWKAVRCSYAQPFVCKQRADSCPGATQWTSSGVISSSNFPSDYDNDLYCKYTLNSPENTRILLNFNTFRTEYYKDYVEVWDGIEGGRLLAKMHGTQPEKTSFESSENLLTVVFITNPTITMKGWSANWTSEPLKDPINVSGTGGIVESPNYPNTYPDNLDQIYHIKVDPSMVVEITILDFVTDSTFDELVIDDGSKMGGKVLKILSENQTKNLPMVITSTQSAASMRFLTDESNEKPVKGWRLSWNAVPRV